jgi:hypothetical protein
MPVKWRSSMKNNICLAAGIVLILLGTVPSAAEARGRMHPRIWGGGPYWGLRDPYWRWEEDPYWRLNGGYLVIESRPTFIFLPSYGFSVSIGTPYDIFYFDHYYYLYGKNYCYSSPFYQGPWDVIDENDLPDIIKKHRIDDIRKVRDLEYRNRENRNNKVNETKNPEDSSGDSLRDESEKKDN